MKQMIDDNGYTIEANGGIRVKRQTTGFETTKTDDEAGIPLGQMILRYGERVETRTRFPPSNTSP